MRGFSWAPLASFAAVVALAIACQHDNPPEQVAQPCQSPADCYPEVDHDALHGEVECLAKVEGGYCTHLCEVDEDCCAIPGECVSGYPQVCAPFENQPNKRCFLSCEVGDVGDLDPDEYCRTYAHASFGCRSSGGGSQNRKICVP